MLILYCSSSIKELLLISGNIYLGIIISKAKIHFLISEEIVRYNTKYLCKLKTCFYVFIAS